MTAPFAAVTQYEVVNEVGRVVSTSDHKDIAVRFAKTQAPRLGRLWVEEVTRTVHRRRVYRPRPAVRAQAEACPA